MTSSRVLLVKQQEVAPFTHGSDWSEVQCKNREMDTSASSSSHPCAACLMCFPHSSSTFCGYAANVCSPRLQLRAIVYVLSVTQASETWLQFFFFLTYNFGQFCCSVNEIMPFVAYLYDGILLHVCRVCLPSLHISSARLRYGIFSRWLSCNSIPTHEAVATN